MTQLLITNARVVTPRQASRDANGALAGPAMRHLDVLPSADVLCEAGCFTRIAPTAGTQGELARAARGVPTLDARGRVLLPGFVDCHTHACFAGSRLDEWQQKLAGVPYLDILRAGGGIHSTVRATRAASLTELQASLSARAARMLAHGTTTLEVKTGYGLLPDAELAMLRAILASPLDAALAGQTRCATALLGHALDPSMDPEAFVDAIIEQALPACAEMLRGVGAPLVVDVYIEQGAWSLPQVCRLFAAAHALGARLRAHADQFSCQGLVEASIDAAMGKPSPLPAPLHTLDHLEATSEAVLAQLGRTPTIAVMLPCTGFHTDQRYANARAIIDAGGRVALATNYNPGTSPCFAMPMAIALGVRCNKLTIAEAIVAATANAAAALALPDRGTIAPGQRADAVLLEGSDERSLAYEFGANPVASVIAGGRVVG